MGRPILPARGGKGREMPEKNGPKEMNAWATTHSENDVDAENGVIQKMKVKRERQAKTSTIGSKKGTLLASDRGRLTRLPRIDYRYLVG